MIRNTLTFAILLLVHLISAKTAHAQIQINGSADFEVQAGGEDSRFIINQIPSNYNKPNFAVTELNAFILAPITETFFVNGRIQMDTWGNGDLNTPRIALLNLTWDNVDKSYTIKLGRFISPFGFYSNRQLSVDRIFNTHPLGYSYFTNISSTRGFWPQAGNSPLEYREGDVGLSTLYFAGYTTGIGTEWTISENTLILEAALTTGTPMVQTERTSLSNLALIARLQYNPSIYWNQGFSLSYGNFMDADPINENVRENNSFGKYKQFLSGTDFTLGFTYFEIIGEMIYSRWNLPQFTNVAFTTQGNELVEYTLSNFSSNLDIKYEPPIFTGSYFALRGEQIYFFEADDPNSTNTIKWDEDTYRLSLAFGYKITHNIVAKASFSEQTPFDGSLYAVRINISAFF